MKNFPQNKDIEIKRNIDIFMSLAGPCVIITAMMDMVVINSQDAYLNVDTILKKEE